MESTIIEVKENVGNRRVKVNIISKSIIPDSIIQCLKDMTLNEVRAFGKNEGWVVEVWGN